MPYWHACDPCNVNFDVIGRTEDTDKDTERILKDIGIEASSLCKFVNPHYSTHSSYIQVSMDFKCGSKQSLVLDCGTVVQKTKK